jgi:hypothetical protein
VTSVSTTETPQAASASNSVVDEQNFSGWEFEGRWTSAPIRWSVSTKRLFVSQFTPSGLRHMASLMEVKSPGMIARRRLSETSVNALAEMYVAGKTPTVGWWRRHAGATVS